MANHTALNWPRLRRKSRTRRSGSADVFLQSSTYLSVRSASGVLSLSMLQKEAMQYRNLGNSGLRVSRIGLALGLSSNYQPRHNAATHCSSVPNLNAHGTALTEEQADQLITAAYDSGINYFDTFDAEQIGRTELMLGKTLKKRKWRRSSYVVSVRVYRSGGSETEKGLSRKHVVESCSYSLERLGLAYVDLVCAQGRDRTPVEEIVRAFNWVIEKGWAFYWTTSNWTPEQVMEAFTVAKYLNLIPPLVNHAEYNFFKRDAVELVVPELLCNIGCGCVTSSALHGGLLNIDSAIDGPSEQSDDPTTKAHPKAMEVNLEHREFFSKIKYLLPVADQISCSLAQLAIAWCLRSEFVQCVLISPVNLEQMREYMISVAIIDKLTPEVLAVVEKILGNQPTFNTNSMTKAKLTTKNSIYGRRRSVCSVSGQRKSVSSSPRLSISHGPVAMEGRLGYRDSIDYPSHDRRPSHI